MIAKKIGSMNDSSVKRREPNVSSTTSKGSMTPAANSAYTHQTAEKSDRPPADMPASTKARNTCCSSVCPGKNTAPANPQVTPEPRTPMANRRSHTSGAVSRLGACL